MSTTFSAGKIQEGGGVTRTQKLGQCSSTRTMVGELQPQVVRLAEEARAKEKLQKLQEALLRSEGKKDQLGSALLPTLVFTRAPHALA